MTEYALVACSIAITILAIVWIIVEFRLNMMLSRLEKNIKDGFIEKVDLDQLFDDLIKETDDDKFTETSDESTNEDEDDVVLDVELQAVIDDFNKLVEDEDLISDDEEQETGNDGNQIKKDDRNVRDS